MPPRTAHAAAPCAEPVLRAVYRLVPPVLPAVLQEEGLYLLIQELQRGLESAAEGRRAAEDAATAARSNWQCRICLTREVDCAMSGCGHMLCGDCAGQLPRPVCPFCRKASQLRRLYR